MHIENKVEAIDYICNIPKLYTVKGGESFIGYCAIAKKLIMEYDITKNDLIIGLKRNNDCLDIWLHHDEFKRTDGGYFIEQKDELYYFGFYIGKNSKNEFVHVSESTDPYIICGEFIFKELHLEENDNAILEYLLEKFFNDRNIS